MSINPRTARVFGKYMRMRERMEDLQIMIVSSESMDVRRERTDYHERMYREYRTKSVRCEVIERYFGFTKQDRRAT